MAQKIVEAESGGSVPQSPVYFPVCGRRMTGEANQWLPVIPLTSLKVYDA